MRKLFFGRSLTAAQARADAHLRRAGPQGKLVSYLIGVDEAGYGPNLGPLVITATVWRMADGLHGCNAAGGATPVDLYPRLAPFVSPEKPGTAHRDALWIADSKTVYSPSDGLATLERGALALLQTAGVCAARSPALWSQLLDGSPGAQAAEHWQADQDEPLPLSAGSDEVQSAAAQLALGLDQAGVELVAIRPRIIFPAYFNRLVAEHGNKAAVLSHLSLGLVAQLLRELPPDAAEIICDKHGGRNYYAAQIQAHFDEGLLETVVERRPASEYRWGPAAQRRRMRFEVGAERHLAVAAASMVSKYLRELAMRGLNDFWRRRVDGLKPTAGYPVDARRFKSHIQRAQAALAIPDHVLWRER